MKKSAMQDHLGLSTYKTLGYVADYKAASPDSIGEVESFQKLLSMLR